MMDQGVVDRDDFIAAFSVVAHVIHDQTPREAKVVWMVKHQEYVNIEMLNWFETIRIF